MRCEQFESAWQALMDERRPLQSDPHLVAHTLKCESCAALAAGMESLLDGLDFGRDQEVGEGFAQRVVMARLLRADTIDTIDAHSGSPPTRLASHSLPATHAGPLGSAAGQPARVRGLIPFLGRAALLVAASCLVMLSLTAMPHRGARPNGLKGLASVAHPTPSRAERQRAAAPGDRQPMPETIAANDGVAAESSASVGQLGDAGLHDLMNLITERSRDEAARELTLRMQRLDDTARRITSSLGTAVTAIYRTVGNQPASGEKSAFAPNLQLSFS
ncbi:MAG: hypothetical protein KDB14_09810 [Planctomycetales bacterium]|nr:hypothetical protein [Planctomycetales bacterium]